MPDYGNPLQFGYFLTPSASNHEQILQLAVQIEQLGLELIGIQDHPYQRRFLDTWTLSAMIAAKTSRLRIFLDVSNLPLRPPAMLAKSAATLDLLSGGRFELGLGAGAFWEGIVAMGGPKRTPKEAFEALEEAIQVIRTLWSDERAASFQGKYYTLRGVHPGPAPAHPIQIWIGAYGPKMMDLIGRMADGWVLTLSYISLAQIKDKQARIDAAAQDAGRNPADIRRIINIAGRITSGNSAGLLNGPIDQWVDELAMLALEYGMDTFVLGGEDISQVRHFSEEIVPEVRAVISKQRSAFL
jgi:alkanesulfonate monooxygenase SsuD/methylene tetrahydromethanopterin reductase-like flavin-dependent oxidoreductase (luciferase family)